MSDKRQETIADIIASKRLRAAEMEKTLGDQHSFVESLKDDADRIEAAWKAEKSVIEADALAIGGIVEAERKRKRDNSGDCAKLREALENVAKQLIDATEDENFGEDVMYLVGCMRTMSQKCRAALAAPPRN